MIAEAESIDSTNIDLSHCYHCGEDCASHPLMLDQKAFCCQGCKTVFEILQGENLCEYYDFEAQPGITMNEDALGEWSHLDHDSIRNDLLEFEDDTMARVRFYIPQIHCSSCIWLLENLHKLNPSVVEVMVNFPQKEVSIAFRKEELKLSGLALLLSSIGYAPNVNMASSSKPKPKHNRRFYYKLGVAFFAFGNIMLLSLPEYFGLSELEQHYGHFFAYLNLMLAIPVFFYCSFDYFQAAYKGLKNKFVTVDVPIALGIVTLFARSTYEILSGTGAGYMDSLAGLVFFLLLGKWYQQRTYQAFSFERDYQSYFPIAVTRVKGGKEESIPIRELDKGDQLRIHNGEIIPADSILLVGTGKIDYSFVSGESEPVSKSKGEFLFAGGKQMGTPITVLVENQVEQSYLTRLWNREAFNKEHDQELGTLTDSVSKYFTLIIIGIATLTGLYYSFFNPAGLWNSTTAVLIVACPCALALSLPFALGNSMRILARHGFFLKNTATLEELAKVSDLTFDKTGTITHPGKHHLRFEGSSMADDEWALIQVVVHSSLHPLSRAIDKWIKHAAELPEITDFEEILGQGVRGTVAGKEVRVGTKAFALGEAGETNETQVFISVDGFSKGVFTFENKYRVGARHTLDTLAQSFELHLLSGDNDSEKERLIPYFHEESQMRFRQSPDDKLDYVKSIQDNGGKVMMVGDGLNDAGALKQSDVGVAIADDIHRFSPACDAILDASQFHRISTFLELAQRSIRLVKTSFVLAFIYNIIGLSFAVSGQLSPLVAAILMPLSSISIIIFAVVGTNLIARKLSL